MRKERSEAVDSGSEPRPNGENQVPDDPQMRPDEVVDALEEQITGSSSREQREQDDAAANDLLSEADSHAAEHPHGEAPS